MSSYCHLFSGMLYKAEADMRREELEKKKNPKVDFVSGGTQPATVVSAPKVIIPIPGPETILLLIQWDKLAFRNYSLFLPHFHVGTGVFLY